MAATPSFAGRNYWQIWQFVFTILLYSYMLSQPKKFGKNKCPYKVGNSVAIFFCCFMKMVQFMLTTDNFSYVNVYIYLFILQIFLVHMSLFDMTSCDLLWSLITCVHYNNVYNKSRWNYISHVCAFYVAIFFRIIFKMYYMILRKSSRSRNASDTHSLFLKCIFAIINFYVFYFQSRKLVWTLLTNIGLNRRYVLFLVTRESAASE